MSTDPQIFKTTVWILAPHFTYPAISGGDVYVLGMAKGLSSRFASVELVGADAQHSIHSGQVVSSVKVDSHLRNKWLASLRTLVFRSSYQKERFLTRKYLNFVKHLFIKEDDLLFVSFLASSDAIQCIKRPFAKSFIITHNFDPEYFDLMAHATSNPLAKLVFELSAKYSLELLKKMKTAVRLVHINENDLSKYASVAQQLQHFLFEAGVSYNEDRFVSLKQFRKQRLEEVHSPILGFVGSLWAAQNIAGLVYFSQAYWPLIQASFPGIEFRVIGSNPGDVVKDLCQRNGWQLFPDLEQESFDQIVAGCHFTVLPFELSAGTKIKILSSVQCLVPVIGTTCSQPTGFHLSPSSMFSDVAADWVNHISAYFRELAKEEALVGLQSLLLNQSWQTKANSFTEMIQYTLQQKGNAEDG